MLAFATSASADELIYGTMQIPYEEFYHAEGVESVDAVSSATTSKWNSPSFASGAYFQAHEGDDGGDILGVEYPVAISEEALEQLGENSYNFQKTEEVPAAYKLVTVQEGAASFSEVQGPEEEAEVTTVITTDTVWGDYEIDLDAIHNQDGISDFGVVHGVLLHTEDGNAYGLRHLENIWLDELSWSSGIVVTEPHGNKMSSEPYADLMGKVITDITYITETGYHVIPTDLYVPVRFEGSVQVENVAVDIGSASVTYTDIPEDYELSYNIDNLEFEIVDGVLTYQDTYPGKYTMRVSDESGKYYSFSTSFILSTDKTIAAFDPESGSLVAADGASAEELQAYLSNITSVKVNDNEYSASGRGAVAIIDMDGVVDTEAVMKQGHGEDAVTIPVFEAGNEYEITVLADGFEPVVFALAIP